LQIIIQLESGANRTELFGPGDKYLRRVRERFGVQITARDGNLIIRGPKEKVDKAAELIESMQRRLKERGGLSHEDIEELAVQRKAGIGPGESKGITVYSRKGVIEPFTKGQSKYVETMMNNDLTFCTGPAGTGKTYLAVAVAVSMLKRKQIRKIVLARPAVEAGERLGFLPGDMQAKVNPYLRPLFDGLEDMMEFSQMRKFLEMDIIEVIPLAFMRGRTLNEAVIICDEAQNTLPSQMLMFLTRMGRGSKMTITGDITQIDLENGQRSGMVDAIEKLCGTKGIGFVELSQNDIVRHSLVQNIVEAYKKRNHK
jgi:phosphate starvation-inducible PhoH-like protein